MEVSKGKLINWLIIVLLVGFWLGVGAYWYIIRYSFGDSMALQQEGRLRHNVLILKMLDEKRPDVAMELLEGLIRADVEVSTEEDAFLTSQWAKELLEKQVQFSNTALKDRSKTLKQLTDETKK